jgi:hypothetical protein
MDRRRGHLFSPALLFPVFHPDVENAPFLHLFPLHQPVGKMAMTIPVV